MLLARLHPLGGCLGSGKHRRNAPASLGRPTASVPATSSSSSSTVAGAGSSGSMRRGPRVALGAAAAAPRRLPAPRPARALPREQAMQEPIGGYTPADYITFSEEPDKQCHHTAEVVVDAPVDAAFSLWAEWTKLLDFLDLVGQIGLDATQPEMALFQCLYRYRKLPLLEIVFLLERQVNHADHSILFQSLYGMPIKGQVQLREQPDGTTRVRLYFTHPVPTVMAQLHIGPFGLETDLATILQENLDVYKQAAEALAPEDWQQQKQQVAVRVQQQQEQQQGQQEQQGQEQQGQPQAPATHVAAAAADVPAAAAAAAAASEEQPGRRRTSASQAAAAAQAADGAPAAAAAEAAAAAPPATGGRQRSTTAGKTASKAAASDDAAAAAGDAAASSSGRTRTASSTTSSSSGSAQRRRASTRSGTASKAAAAAAAAAGPEDPPGSSNGAGQQAGGSAGSAGGGGGGRRATARRSSRRTASKE